MTGVTQGVADSVAAKKLAPAEERQYDPKAFDVASFSQAQYMILTPDAQGSTEERWKLETEHTVGFVGEWLRRRNDVACLDYGSGVGRLAKPLIDRFGWSVIGADISLSMRNYADAYVASPYYLTCRPELLDHHLHGYFDYAIAVLTLQHCVAPLVDIDRIARALKPGGRLFVLNYLIRAVPAGGEWVNDGVDVFAMLGSRLTELGSGDCPWMTEHRWAVYGKAAPELF